MAKTNPTLRVFNRLLDRADSLIYFIDDQAKIRFANDALAVWLGVGIEKIKDQVAVYQATELASVIAEKTSGLCPPPDLLESDAIRHQFFVSRKTESGQEFCFAKGVRIEGTSQGSGMLVVVDPSEAATSIDELWARIEAKPDLEVAGRLHSELAELVSSIDKSFPVDTLVGTSQFAARIRRQVEAAASANCDTLIHGPFGCGKENLARSICSALNRGNEIELAPIYCAIADAPVIQQRINEARKSMKTSGTKQLVLLLLDVDRLWLDAQNELMGFLELPGPRINTLSTSTMSLQQLFDSPSFSNDLAYRISSMNLSMVPLKERIEDIPLLAQAILESENDSQRIQLSGFSDRVIERMKEYNWPENINELRRTVTFAASSCKGSTVDEEHLPIEFHQALTAQRIGKPVEVSIDLDQYLESIERALIGRALKQTRGNKTQAAKQLGLNRPRLLRRLQHLGMTEYLAAASGKQVEQIDPSAFEEVVDE